MTAPATLTHAGAVVWRRGADAPLFLLVTASGRRDEWVLPKGHIEKGESAAEAAYREVLEETGFAASVTERLGTDAFAAKGAEVVCAYFLSRYTGGGLPMGGDVAEGRLAVWLPLAEAIERATFPACRKMLELAGNEIGLRR